MWIKIKYCIMLNNAEDIILNITDILTLPWPGHLNLALTRITEGEKQPPSVNQSYNQRPALADAMSIPIVKSGT